MSCTFRKDLIEIALASPGAEALAPLIAELQTAGPYGDATPDEIGRFMDALDAAEEAL